MNFEEGDIQQYLQQGMIFFTKNQMQDAITTFMKAIQQNKEWYERFCSRGLLFQNLHLGQQAVKEFIDRFCLESEKVLANYLKSNILLLQEKYEQAFEILNDGTINVFFPHKYLDLGIAFQGLGQYDDACQFYCQFIETEEEQKYYLSYYYRGTSYLQLGHKEEALKDFNLCIELNPNFAEAYIEKGLLLQDEKQARINLEKGVSLSPINPYYLLRLGLFLYKTFNVDQALVYLNKVDTLWHKKQDLKNLYLTSWQIKFIKENLDKHQRQFKSGKQRSLSIQSSQGIHQLIYEQQRQIARLQQQVNYLAQQQKKIQKSLSPLKQKQNQFEAKQRVFEKILENDIIIMNNWERLKMVGNECERIYCECLFWKLSSFIHACIQANTKIFQTNPQNFKPNNTQLTNFFIESSIALLKIIGFVPSIGAIATIIGEALQDINESGKKISFREKIEKIALVAQKSTIGQNIDEQIQLATFQMGSVLIERQFKWKNKKPQFSKQIEKMTQIEKDIGNKEACRNEYQKGIEDCLYILQYIIGDCQLFLEKEISLNEVIMYIFKTYIYKS